MLKLYGGVFSRASIVKWYLEEIGVAYEFIQLDLSLGQHLQPEYLAINPIGKVPAIEDGEFRLWESGAILLYLAEKYGKEADSLEERSIINQWIIFANSTLSTGLFVESSREKEAPKLLTALNQIFEKTPYILGDEFSVADVAVGSILGYATMMLKMDFQEYPAIADYQKRIIERPAFQKTIGAR